MPNCIKCSELIPIGNALYCPFCGASQVVKEKPKEKPGRAPKARGNGQGTAFKRGNTWTASVTVGWKYPNGDITKPKYPVKKTKGGFKSKKEAIEYCPQLRLQGNNIKHMTLEETYNAWKKMYESRIVPSTMFGLYTLWASAWHRHEGYLIR